MYFTVKQSVSLERLPWVQKGESELYNKRLSFGNLVAAGTIKLLFFPEMGHSTMDLERLHRTLISSFCVCSQVALPSLLAQWWNLVKVSQCKGLENAVISSDELHCRSHCFSKTALPFALELRWSYGPLHVIVAKQHRRTLKQSTTSCIKQWLRQHLGSYNSTTKK